MTKIGTMGRIVPKTGDLTALVDAVEEALRGVA